MGRSVRITPSNRNSSTTPKKKKAASFEPDPNLPEAFDWKNVHLYRNSQSPWPDGYPQEFKDFFSPEDGKGIHALLVQLIRSATKSVVLNMFGYDDNEIDAEIHKHSHNPKVYLQMSLDRTQASGAHERELLAKWNNDGIGNSIAIGKSAKNAISHLKVLIVDGEYVVTGSTNWSFSGEEEQDNQLTLLHSAIVAATYRSILDINHTQMLKQMAQKAQQEGKRKVS
jgi:phosphatidylserine/phosphatidylglycerophosphate/cardiolipin synthase-like enzyme